jgi:hypothetical protein
VLSRLPRRSRRLRPRNVLQPPLSEGDRRVYATIVERSRMRSEMEVDVRFERDHATAQPSISIHG